VAVRDASDGAILIRADLEKKFDDKCVSAFARVNPTLLEEISWRFWGRISTIRACPPKAAFARGDISAGDGEEARRCECLRLEMHIQNRSQNYQQRAGLQV
jgi:hypothetical protein